ncbi:DUF6507 family protein [Microbacterium sp. AZCO]|uniref:DUF6507 family protein n=1 Tax=Microbacterium sp. AZCO TaxID=3142976 RepID=UPI0031F3E16F
MTHWSIQPSGVVAVLKDVNTYATALGEALNGLGPALEGALAGAAGSPAIGGALQEYFDREEGPRIEGMNARISAAASGVVNATQAYVNGDLEMAANAQSASVAAVYPPQLPRGVQ